MKHSVIGILGAAFQRAVFRPMPKPPTSEDYYLAHLKGRVRDHHNGPAIPPRPTLW